MSSVPYDPAQYLRTNEEIVAYLNAALERGEPALFLVALGNVARARGMTEVSELSGLNRESLYKMLYEASYSARYFICIPPLAKGGGGI
jgi:probable addiction module antidote protein